MYLTPKVKYRKKMKKRWLLISIIFGLLEFFALNGNTLGNSIELTYSNFFTTNHGQSQLAEAWIKEIEEKTHKRVEIIYLPGETFLKGHRIYDGVIKGYTDIGMSSFAHTITRFPAMGTLSLPLGYPSGKVATSVANKFYERFKPEELKDVKVLYLHTSSPALLHTLRPVHRLQDLMGMKIYCSGFGIKIVKALGALPVTMKEKEIYGLWEKEKHGAIFAPLGLLKGFGQKEINYTINCKDIGYTTGFYVIMNREKWLSLPMDIKNIFTEISKKWIMKHGQGWDKNGNEGLKIIELNSEENNRWKKAIEPIIDEYVKEIKAKGLPGDKYIETIKLFIEESQSSLEEKK
jgi:TRAP-type C4-dicarboxylate transport system substrate-binding protein